MGSLSKPCKGINKAKGYGCGEVVSYRVYGLCAKCFKTWLFTTAEGELEIKKRSLKASEQNWKKRKAKIKKELETVQDLVKKAQKLFNTYIRNRDRGRKCISCTNILEGKFDAGHFYNANNHWSLRFDLSNVHGQCVACNQHKHGNLLEYRKGLLDRIGEQELLRLEEESTKTRKYTREELREIITNYKT